MSNPSLRNAVGSTGAASTSIVVTPPTYSNGDLLIVAIGRTYPQNGTLTTLSGWTKWSGVASQIGAGAIGITEIYTRLATGAETWTWADSGSDAYEAVAMSYQNCDPTTPVDTGGSAQHGQSNTASTTMTDPGVTSTHPSATIVQICRYQNSGTVTFNALLTQRFAAAYFASVSASIAAADYAQTSAGATGALNGTIGTSGRSVVGTLALNPILTTPQFWTDYIKSAEVDS
jgi:hypothetical protein